MGILPWLSTTSLAGSLPLFGLISLTVSNGLSTRTVEIPTKIASTDERNSWTLTRSRLDEIREFPQVVAILPSTVIAALIVIRKFEL